MKKIRNTKRHAKTGLLDGEEQPVKSRAEGIFYMEIRSSLSEIFADCNC